MPKKGPSYTQMSYGPKLHVHWLIWLQISGDNVVHKLEQAGDAYRDDGCHLPFPGSLQPRPCALGAPLGIVWLSGGRGLEAADTQSRSNLGTTTFLLASSF